uniref:Reverse transcriptase domain-containing protein n=1 Tax=Periophthalmus magnuspinnatus TaxID=409849 RepID=A0A3B4ALQ4_9GOBI
RRAWLTLSFSSSGPVWRPWKRGTAFFFGLEKRKQGKLFIQELTDSAGVTSADHCTLLETIQTFYSELFRAQGTSEARLTEGDRDGPITAAEVREAIKGLNNNKSPGQDGLTSEFYKTFAHRIAPILQSLYTQMQSENRFSTLFCTSVITLLHKKDSKLDLENYRPISLLNTDYKILTKILANRLRLVIASVISPTQSYSVPHRDIANNILTNNVDFRKAFDRVEHSFLWDVLRQFGFGDTFISWIQLLYQNARSRVKCNGSLTDTFPLSRSVRQGCPLSSLLYSIVAEPLAALIKKNPHGNCGDLCLVFHKKRIGEHNLVLFLSSHLINVQKESAHCWQDSKLHREAPMDVLSIALTTWPQKFSCMQFKKETDVTKSSLIK